MKQVWCKFDRDEVGFKHVTNELIPCEQTWRSDKLLRLREAADCSWQAIQIYVPFYKLHFDAFNTPDISFKIDDYVSLIKYQTLLGDTRLSLHGQPRLSLRPISV